MTVFNEKQEELEHFETRRGVPRGRLAVTMDLVTDAMALVGQHGVYCPSQRWPGRPVMDVQLIMKNLTGAQDLLGFNDRARARRRYRSAALVGFRRDHSYRVRLLVDRLPQRLV